jgi:glycogen debranching enzyme
LPFEPRWLLERAATLRRRFLREFWLPEMGTFALAQTCEADGLLRPARVAASSPGHLLASRLLDGTPYVRPLIWRFQQPDLLAGAGIRTKSVGAARYRAGSYHNGSTWPMDTGVIADGLRRHGAHAFASALDQRVVAACQRVGSYPEFFRGSREVAVNTDVVDAVVDGVVNRLEQPPQSNQGWTATRVWKILSS